METATIVTGDKYLDSLVRFVDANTGALIDGSIVLKLNPVGLHYVQSRIESLSEVEALLIGAPVDYLRAYVSDLGDHRALEQLRRILRLLTCLKVVSALPGPARDPTPVKVVGFGRLKVLEMRGCDLSTSAARGLLELRHTLEKLICHNSTDALRHVFASRIAEIKDSPLWNRLSFVSCALNDLLLMDESLQLLPVVETLDLSRNKFAKVDNLSKCTRLKHLDLGFNQVRTVASFGEVSRHLVKLVLRNNALTTLRGLENLKCLEGLDLSYNIISNFSELGILAGFPSLSCLWLEGNPICCARWYRSQVFSIFLYPDKLTVDGNKISTREFWRVQIITASRQKQPASFGFYFPAKGDAKLEGTMNTKRRRHSRLARIEGEELGMHTNSDEESVACENDTHSKVEDLILDEETEIVNFVERIEKMKKERSDLWLQEFKKWLIQDSENCLSTNNSLIPDFDADKDSPKNNTKRSYFGESSRYVSDTIQASGDDTTANIFKLNGSLAVHSFVVNSHHYHGGISEISNFSIGDTHTNCEPVVGCQDGKQEQVKSHTEEYVSGRAGNFPPVLIPVQRGERKSREPPHYQDDILHRCHNLVEEYLQLSAESFSVASSDSNTSFGEDDFTEYGPSIPDSDLALIEELSERSSFSTLRHSEDMQYQRGNGVHELAQNGSRVSDSSAEASLGFLKFRGCHNFRSDEYDGEVVHSMNRVDNWLGKKSSNRKPQSRLIALVEEINHIVGNTEPELRLNGDLNLYVNKIKDRLQKPDRKGTHDWEITPSSDGLRNFSASKSSLLDTENFLEHYFNTNFANKGVGETCRKCVTCNCIIQQTNGCKESEVALLLSSDCKLYVMLIDKDCDGSEINFSLMDSHKRNDVRLVLVGLGLQFLRVYIENGGTYLLITRSIHKSRELLGLLNCLDSETRELNCCTKSVEQVQVELFQRDICGCLRLSMFQYAMVLFWCSDMKEDIWLSRSLFVLEQHLLVCTEDFMNCGSLSVDTSPYFTLHSCCFIGDVSETVIDNIAGWSIILSIENATTEFWSSKKMESKAQLSHPVVWKLKWFSKDALFNFVAVLKAIHVDAANSSSSPLLVSCRS